MTKREEEKNQQLKENEHQARRHSVSGLITKPFHRSAYRTTVYRAVFIKSLLLCFLLCLISIAGCKKDPPTQPKQENLYLKVRLVISEEVSDLVDELTAAFHAGVAHLTDGRLIQLEVIKDSGFKSAERLADGTTKTELWLAPSTSMIHWVNTHLQNLGPEQTQCTQLFATPLVIGARTSAAGILKATQQEFSWNTFIRNQLPNLSTYDKELRHLTLEHVPPQQAPDGITATLQLFYLANSLDRPAAETDLISEQGLKKLKEFEQYARGYPGSNRAALAQVGRAPNADLRLVITTERDLARYNASTKHSSPEVTAFYPAEGSYWQDYSLCLSNADWLTPAHRAAAKIVSDFFQSREAQYRAKRAGFRPSVVQFEPVAPLLPEFGVNTTLPNRSLKALSAEVVDHLLKIWPGVRRPAAYVLLLDTSGSMEVEALGAAQRGLRNFVAAQSDQDESAVITFSTTPKLGVDFTHKKKKAIEVIDRAQSVGGSAVYDALKEALNVIEAGEHTTQRRSIIVVTDGGDQNSRYRKGGVISAFQHSLKKYPIELNVFALTDKGTNHRELKELVERSGGSFYAVSARKLEAKMRAVL